MVFRSYVQIGDQLVSRWGITSELSEESQERALTESQKLTCLLAAAVYQMRAVRDEVDSLKRSLRASQNAIKKALGDAPDPVAAGTLQWIKSFDPYSDMEIQKMDQLTLTVRARKALIRSGLTRRSQITAEALAGLKGCGSGTIRELVEWAAKGRLLEDKKPVAAASGQVQKTVQAEGKPELPPDGQLESRGMYMAAVKSRMYQEIELAARRLAKIVPPDMAEEFLGHVFYEHHVFCNDIVCTGPSDIVPDLYGDQAYQDYVKAKYEEFRKHEDNQGTS